MGALMAACAAVQDQAWEDYKLEYNKHYTAEEELTRYTNWKKSVEEVTLHNAAYGHEFTTGINDMSDLTEEEYESIYLSGLRVPEGPSNATMYVPTNDAIPEDCPTPSLLSDTDLREAATTTW